MKKITAVLIDNKCDCRDALRQKLTKHCPDVEVIAECKDGKEGISTIKKKGPNIVFLEVEIPKVDGLTMLQQLGNINAQLIFTCTDDHFAIDAIHFKALDYLVKPIKTPQLLEAVERIRQTIRGLKTGSHGLDIKSVSHKRMSDNCIEIHSMKGIQHIAFADIMFLQAKSNYSIIHQQSSHSITVSKTLKDLENFLPSSVFIRIHHCWIVNKEYIQSYCMCKSSQVVMSSGKVLGVSRRRREHFIKEMCH